VLSRGFFSRPTLDVARDLVGVRLLTGEGSADVVEATIVEVEAYLGTDDPASHAFRGPTPRAAIMFGEPGHLYVYLSYGMHRCANIVCEPEGVAGAVLLRAAAVDRGEPTVRARRGPAPPADGLLRGPGNLTSGLGIGLDLNGIDITAPGAAVRVMSGEHPPIASGPRVGISRAVDAPHRFAWAGHPAVSLPRLAAPRPAGQKKRAGGAGPR
jgi:DNA-3-methyladenine glycosylase